MTSSNYNYQYSIEQKLSYWIVFSVFDQYTTHFSVHPVSWKIVYELCQNNAPRKLWKFNIPGIYWMFSFIILQDIYFTCLTLSTGIPIESLYISTKQHTHLSPWAIMHFCTSRIKEKKNSYMFQTKYLN